MKIRNRCFLMLVCILVSYTSLQAVGLEPVDIHGFISQGFMKSSDNNYFAETKDGTFQFNEMGINFSSKLTPRLRIGLQFFARDLGDLGNDEVTLDWVFGDYRWQDWLGIRVGKIKIPLGLYNEVRDIDMVRTFINLPQSVYQERYRESWVAVKGAGLYGKVGSDSLGTLGYQFQMGSMEASKESGAAKHMESMVGMGILETSEDFNMDQAYAGKIEWQTPVIPLRLAASILQYGFVVPLLNPGTGSTVEVDVDLLRSTVGSMEYSWENLIIVFEYSEIDFEGFYLIPFDLTAQGYYGSVAYRFFEWLELGIYYSVYYPDTSDKDGKENVSRFQFKKDFQSWSKDACLTVRFDINSNWIFKLEGHLMNGAADLFDMDNLDEDTPYVNNQPVLDIEEDWMLFAVKLSYTF